MASNEEKVIRSEGSLKDKLRHAFAVGGKSDQLLEDEIELLRDIAKRVHKRKLSAAAIPFLLFHQPLNTVGANLLQMTEFALTLKPVETFLKRFMGPKATHERLVRTLEKRPSIETLVGFLEAQIDESL